MQTRGLCRPSFIAFEHSHARLELNACQINLLNLGLSHFHAALMSKTLRIQISKMHLLQIGARNLNSRQANVRKCNETLFMIEIIPMK